MPLRVLPWCSSGKEKIERLRGLEKEMGVERKKGAVVECKLWIARKFAKTKLPIS